MKTLHSPKAGKAEIISFILLVFLSAAVFIVWNAQEKNHNQKKKNLIEVAPAENKVSQNSEINFCKDSVQTQEVHTPISLDKPRVKHVKKEEPVAGILPPLPAYEMQLTENTVSAAAGELITTGKNSQIHIPPHAFVDAQGKIVEGDVKVSYREYHSSLDIFLSGIPMEYEKGTMESAGMIEINAAQNGEPVYVNPENKISVMLASANKETNYNLYYFDQEKNKWEQRGKDKIVLTSKTQAADEESAFVDSIQKKFYFEPTKCPMLLFCRSDMRARKKHWFARKGISYVFDFSFSRKRKMSEELKELSGITWRYYGKDAGDVYMQLFGLKKMPKRTLNSESVLTAYTYVTEDPDAGPRNYQIHFTIGRTTTSIPVVPVFRSERSANSFNKKWEKYSEAYAKLRESEQKRFEQFQADTAAYFACNTRYEKVNVTGESAALRVFEINNFGIWNCDRLLPEMTARVIARFTDEKGRSLDINRGYLVMKSVNAVYTIYDFSNFSFDPKAETLFWTVLPDNKLAIVRPEEFAKHQAATKGSRCRFTMQINLTALDNISSIQSALGFN